MKKQRVKSNGTPMWMLHILRISFKYGGSVKIEVVSRNFEFKNNEDGN